MTETLQLLKAYIEAEGYEINTFPTTSALDPSMSTAECMAVQARYTRNEFKVTKRTPKEGSTRDEVAIRAEIANEKRLNMKEDIDDCIDIALGLKRAADSKFSSEESAILIDRLESMKDKL